MEIKKNKKFYVIHFIYFSSMETDINFLLVLFPCLGADRLLPGGGVEGGWLFCWGIITKIFIGLGVSFSDKGSLPGGLIK